MMLGRKATPACRLQLNPNKKSPDLPESFPSTGLTNDKDTQKLVGALNKALKPDGNLQIIACGYAGGNDKPWHKGIQEITDILQCNTVWSPVRVAWNRDSKRFMQPDKDPEADLEWVQKKPTPKK
jgi:hypothetical protein